MAHDALTLPNATAYVADLLADARSLIDVAMATTLALILDPDVSFDYPDDPFD